MLNLIYTNQYLGCPVDSIRESELIVKKLNPTKSACNDFTFNETFHDKFVQSVRYESFYNDYVVTLYITFCLIRKASTTEQHKSAITDHVAQENHIIKWDEAKILDRDSNTFSRRIREAIEIRKKGVKAINRDEGSFTLDHVYDSLLCTTSHPRKENNKKFPGKSSEPRHL